MMRMKIKNPFLKGFDITGFHTRGVQVLQAALVLFVVGFVIGHPGIEVSVTQNGMDYFTGYMINKVSERLTGKSLFYRKEYETNVYETLAFIHYDEIANASIPTFKILSKLGIGLEISLSNVDTDIKGTLNYLEQGITVPEEPEPTTVSVRGVDLTFLLQIRNKGGYPVVEISSCTCKIKDIFLVFETGSPSTLAPPSFLATKFRNDVKAIMCREVTRSILHYLNRHLDMAGVIHFDDLMMDLTLLGDVVYDNNFLKFSYNGKFVGDNEELKQTNMSTSLEGMVTTTISAQVLESMLRVQHGSENVYISQEVDLWPDDIKALGLNWSKSEFKFILTYKTQKHQTVEISPNGIVTKINGTMTITSTTDVKENTTLDISIVNRYQVYLGKIRKSLQFTYAKQSLLLRNPGLSQTGLDRIQEILKRNFKTIVPAIKFFKLPIGFLPKNSSITHENDFLKVVSNFNFD